MQHEVARDNPKWHKITKSKKKEEKINEPNWHHRPVSICNKVKYVLHQHDRLGQLQSKNKVLIDGCQCQEWIIYPYEELRDRFLFLHQMEHRFQVIYQQLDHDRIVQRNVKVLEWVNKYVMTCSGYSQSLTQSILCFNINLCTFFK